MEMVGLDPKKVEEIAERAGDYLSGAGVSAMICPRSEFYGYDNSELAIGYAADLHGKRPDSD